MPVSMCAHVFVSLYVRIFGCACVLSPCVCVHVCVSVNVRIFGVCAHMCISASGYEFACVCECLRVRPCAHMINKKSPGIV